MIDEIFSCPVRKYNINNDAITNCFTNIYDKEKFQQESPFTFRLIDVDSFTTQAYVDILEEFVKDLGLGDTHVGIISDVILCVLQKGEVLGNCNTLPSHYTLTHFIKGSDPDVYHHPAKTFLEVFNPGLDEWGSAVSLYINEGDVVIHPSYLEYSTPAVKKQRMTLSMMVQLEKK